MTKEVGDIRKAPSKVDGENLIINIRKEYDLWTDKTELRWLRYESDNTQ